MARTYSTSRDAPTYLPGQTHAPRIIDICLGEDNALSPLLIPRAQRMAVTEAAQSMALVR